MKHFIRHAKRKHNIGRAIKVGLVVGTILAAINHYDMFLVGEYSITRFIQIGVTYLVPFSVNLHGSAMSGRHHELKEKQNQGIV